MLARYVTSFPALILTGLVMKHVVSALVTSGITSVDNLPSLLTCTASAMCDLPSSRDSAPASTPVDARRAGARLFCVSTDVSVGVVVSGASGA